MMNYKKSFAFIGLITSSIALSSNPAQAFNLTTGINSGSCSALTAPFTGNLSTATLPTCTTDDGFTIKAAPTGKQLQGKKVNGIIGVGVSGTSQDDPTDAVKGEVDYRESIKLTLPNPKDVLTNIGLSFLYQPGVFSDKVNEAVKITTDTGLEGILKVTGNASATWSFLGGGLVTNLSPSTNQGGGYYNIDNPFGNLKFTSLTLSPLTYNISSNNQSLGLEDSANSDFALTHASAKSVPEPTAIAGLGLVGGLLLATRRRKLSRVS
jgi:hypothetical protein